MAGFLTLPWDAGFARAQQGTRRGVGGIGAALASFSRL